MPAHYLFGDEVERTIRPVGVKKIVVSVTVGHFLFDALIVFVHQQITLVADVSSVGSAYIRDLGLHFPFRTAWLSIPSPVVNFSVMFRDDRDFVFVFA